MGILFFEIFGCFIVVVIVWVGVVCGVCVGFFFFLAKWHLDPLPVFGNSLLLRVWLNGQSPPHTTHTEMLHT